MHHKRHRPKYQRAGCSCLNKGLKKNGAPPLVTVRGIHASFDVRDVDLVAEGILDYEDECEDFELAVWREPPQIGFWFSGGLLPAPRS